MSMLEHLRLRFAIWRLERRIEAAIESMEYHRRTGYLCLGIADRDSRVLSHSKQELERITTAFAHGVVAS